MPSDKKTGMTLPTGILQPTMPRDEPAAADITFSFPAIPYVDHAQSPPRAKRRKEFRSCIGPPAGPEAGVRCPRESPEDPPTSGGLSGNLQARIG